MPQVQSYDVRGAKYMDVLKAWVDNGADVNDHTLVDMASGIVNRGCHDAPHEGSSSVDPCGNGEVHAADKRRINFRVMFEAMMSAPQVTFSTGTAWDTTQKGTPLAENTFNEETAGAAGGGWKASPLAVVVVGTSFLVIGAIAGSLLGYKVGKRRIQSSRECTPYTPDMVSSTQMYDIGIPAKPVLSRRPSSIRNALERQVRGLMGGASVGWCGAVATHIAFRTAHSARRYTSRYHFYAGARPPTHRPTHELQDQLQGIFPRPTR